jgi:hypothetical protein
MAFEGPGVAGKLRASADKAALYAVMTEGATPKVGEGWVAWVAEDLVGRCCALNVFRRFKLDTPLRRPLLDFRWNWAHP